MAWDLQFKVRPIIQIIVKLPRKHTNESRVLLETMDTIVTLIQELTLIVEIGSI